MRRLAWLVMIAAVMVAAPSAQAAKAKVIWTEISMPSNQDRPDLERHLREVVTRQTRRMDWGHHGDEAIEAKIEVTEFTAVTSGGVVRVTCAGHGRLSGGQGGRVARSRFSMGGRPRERAALERQLVAMLGRGLVTRLADMSRSAR